MNVRNVAVAGMVVLVTSALFTAPGLDRLGGLSVDVLFWLRHQAVGPRHAPAESPSVVIAIDEETYQTEPFHSLPKVMWTKQLAAVIDATLAGGAKVVGFDVIYPTSVERFIKGFDRELLVTLRRASTAGRVVLGKVQHQVKPIAPFPGYSFAVGHNRNIRSLNLFREDDGVIRRVPMLFRTSGGGEEPSMALELAARARGVAPRRTADGAIALGDDPIPGSRNNRIAINFDGGAGAIPTYSLADLRACAEKGDTAYFRRHFAGKVVFIGAVLDVEDRKLTSQRFITAPEGQGLPKRCVNPVMTGLYDEALTRDTIPGVYIHAHAVNNLLRGEALRELDRGAVWLVTFALAAVAASATMSVSFLSAGLALMLGSAAWAALATWLFADAMVAPLLRPLAAALVSFALLLGYRFTIADKDKRYIRQAFSLYLPAAVVERMVGEGRAPSLGGETRELTVWFSDMANFTALSEGLAPERLVELLNQYFLEMTTLIEEHGGFIDKYIGDAILAVFGAPLDDPDHAAHGVEAALACERRLVELKERLAWSPGVPLAARVGISSGEVLVGNIGSRRRFNYTVMGDAVNLASRLEGVNKVYGTRILASEGTVVLCRDRVDFREVDQVRVVGRAAPVRIYQPLGPAVAGGGTPGAAQFARFAEALEAFRARRFAEAADAFAALAGDDPVARVFADRARAFAAAPPPPDWDGVANLTSK